MLREHQPPPVFLYGLCAAGSAAISQPVGLRPRFLMLAFPMVHGRRHPLLGSDPPVPGGRLGRAAGPDDRPRGRVQRGVPVILDEPLAPVPERAGRSRRRAPGSWRDRRRRREVGRADAGARPAVRLDPGLGGRAGAPRSTTGVVAGRVVGRRPGPAAGRWWPWSVRSWCGRWPVRCRPAMQRFGLVGGLVTVAVSEGTGIHLRHFYATDSAAFNQVATRLFLDGTNPYTSSMAGAARLLHPVAALLDLPGRRGPHPEGLLPGGLVPAPGPAHGPRAHHMVTDWVDLAAWLVTAVLIFAMVPPVLRWLAPLLLLTGVFLGPFASGGTDALFVPFLVIAVWRWDRFPGRAVAWLPSWVGPVEPGHRLLDQADPVVLRPVPPGGGGLRGPPGRPAAGGRVALRYGAVAVGHLPGGQRPVHRLVAVGLAAGHLPSHGRPAGRRRAGRRGLRPARPDRRRGAAVAVGRGRPGPGGPAGRLRPVGGPAQAGLAVPGPPGPLRARPQPGQLPDRLRAGRPGGRPERAAVRTVGAAVRRPRARRTGRRPWPTGPGRRPSPPSASVALVAVAFTSAPLASPWTGWRWPGWRPSTEGSASARSR